MSGGGGGGPIERLLIFHLHLAEQATGGQALDEGASEEEILEAVLYYYHDADHQEPQLTMEEKERRKKSSVSSNSRNSQIVSFLGLCTALYHLPQVLADDGDQEDPVDMVHLEGCSLVFVLLERDIVAVAQTAYCSSFSKNTSSSTSSSSSSTPSAVRRAIQRCHDFFGLWRGGGIQRRLQTTRRVKSSSSVLLTDTTTTTLLTTAEEEDYDDEEAQRINGKSSSSCIYPGMDQLYNLRKRFRKLRDENTSASAGGGSGGGTREQQQQLAEAIEDLSARLPVAALRHDLRVHYDAFLSEINGSSGEGSYLRNLVEGLPPPLSSSPHQHGVCPAPAALKQLNISNDEHDVEATTRQVSTAIRRLLDNSSPKLRDERPCLLGVSTFVRGTLACPTQTCLEDGDAKKLSLSNETAVNLMWYMSRFQFPLIPSDSILEASTSAGGTTPPHARSFRPFALSFTADLDDPLPHATPMDAAVGGFLAPPPLACLSALDEANAFAGPSSSFSDDNDGDNDDGNQNTQVWVPPVCLPLCVQDDPASKTVTQHLDARVCVYCRGDFSFLFYLSSSPTVASNDPEEGLDPSLYRQLFSSIEKELVCAVPGVKNGDAKAGENGTATAITTALTSEDGKTPQHWQREGLDVISIDRQTHTLSLFRDPRSYEDRTNKKEQRKLTKALLFQSHRREQQQLLPSPGKNLQSPPPSGGAANLSTLGLDCRYQLASHLSTDAVLAFEDAFDEVQAFRQSSGGDTSKCFEMCTLLAKRWVYAFAQDGDKELYILFDTAFFVTVADVQKAALQIREELLSTTKE